MSTTESTAEPTTGVDAVVIDPTGSAVIRKIEPDLYVLKGIIGGWLEAIYPDGALDAIASGEEPLLTWHGYVNEEGKLDGLPINNTATMLAATLGWSGSLRGDVLVGPLVLLGAGGEDDAEEADVPAEVIEVVKRFYGDYPDMLTDERS